MSQLGKKLKFLRKLGNGVVDACRSSLTLHALVNSKILKPSNSDKHSLGFFVLMPQVGNTILI